MIASIEPITIICVVGARPNFMKISPIMRVFATCDRVRAILVHTGQHYDVPMKKAIFDQLEIPDPDFDLGVGSGSHATQTAEVMVRFEPVVDSVVPDAVLVVGDVNSTIACALVAAKKGVPLFHVEAGLRSFDRQMPEEINRVLTDQLSDLLFTTEKQAAINLEREGIDPARIRFVGNVMIDSLVFNLSRCAPVSQSSEIFGRLGITRSSGYGVITLHRPSNVDDPDTLRSLVETLLSVNKFVPLIFPIHPRTRERLIAIGALKDVEDQLVATPPLPYLDLLELLSSAKIALTDSGGIQEETTAMGIPCLTLRHNTERPVTVTEGTNTVVGTDRDAIMRCVSEILTTGGKAGRVPELWDGHAAERILAEILDWNARRTLV